jgi:hypothetical protein
VHERHGHGLIIIRRSARPKQFMIILVMEMPEVGKICEQDRKAWEVALEGVYGLIGVERSK